MKKMTNEEDAPFECHRQVFSESSAIVVTITEVAFGHGVAFDHRLLVPEHGLRIIRLGAYSHVRTLHCVVVVMSVGHV